MNELFPIEQVSADSPKVVWMDANRITLTENKSFRVRPWTAWSAMRPQVVAYGADQDDALHMLAMKLKLKLWNEVAL